MAGEPRAVVLVTADDDPHFRAAAFVDEVVGEDGRAAWRVEMPASNFDEGIVDLHAWLYDESGRAPRPIPDRAKDLKVSGSLGTGGRAGSGRRLRGEFVLAAWGEVGATFSASWIGPGVGPAD